MGFDQRAFPLVEAPGLIENGERNFGLADVMEHRGRIQPLDVSLRQAKAQAKVDGYSRNQEAVLKGALVVATNRREPVGQTIFRDTCRDFATGVLGTLDVDSSTA